MKRTELEKRERELRRKQKKDEVISRKSSAGEASTNPGYYIDALFSLLRYDKNEIFNTQTDISVLEVLETMKSALPEKQWENVLKKAIKKTGVASKDKAYKELMDLIAG